MFYQNFASQKDIFICYIYFKRILINKVIKKKNKRRDLKLLGNKQKMNNF